MPPNPTWESRSLFLVAGAFGNDCFLTPGIHSMVVYLQVVVHLRAVPAPGYQHHLGTCKKCRPEGSTLDLLHQKLRRVAHSPPCHPSLQEAFKFEKPCFTLMTWSVQEALDEKPWSRAFRFVTAFSAVTLLCSHHLSLGLRRSRHPRGKFETQQAVIPRSSLPPDPGNLSSASSLWICLF